jgi:type II secretory pathway component PulC
MNGFDLTVPSDAAQALMALKTEQDVSLLVQSLLFSLNPGLEDE